MGQRAVTEMLRENAPALGVQPQRRRAYEELEGLVAIANDFDLEGEFELANEADGLLRSLAAKEKRPTTSFIFGPDHPKVSDHRGHFPIPDAGHGRSALSRVNQYKGGKKPPWWKGSLQELVNAVNRAVHSKFPKIEISEKSKKPGKG